MNIGFPGTRPAFQPRFGDSTLEAQMKPLSPDLSAVDFAKIQKGGYRPSSAGKMPNGEIAVIALRNMDAVVPPWMEAAQNAKPEVIVYYGLPGQLVEHPVSHYLSEAGCTDFYFEDGFSASVDMGFATGRVAMTVNGQTSVQAIRL